MTGHKILAQRLHSACTTPCIPVHFPPFLPFFSARQNLPRFFFLNRLPSCYSEPLQSKCLSKGMLFAEMAPAYLRKHNVVLHGITSTHVAQEIQIVQI